MIARRHGAATRTGIDPIAAALDDPPPLTHPHMTPFLLITGLSILLAAGVLYLDGPRAIWRTREMRMLARRMGWRFQPRPPLDVVADRARFGLFTVRMHQQARNHLAGTVDRYQVAVFDLRYSSVGRAGARPCEQTVVHVHWPHLHLPAFSLRPESVLHRTGDRVGGGDIDLREDPAFSRDYHLRGASEYAVRDAFDAHVRAAYQRQDGISADGEGQDLLVWRRGAVARAEDVAALVEAALDLARQHSRAAYQLTGHTLGNHTPHVAARLSARRWQETFDDAF